MKRRNTMTALAFSPDGNKLAVASMAAFGHKDAVDVWQLENGRGIQTLRGLANAVTRVAFSPEDRYLAALAHDWQVGVWDLQAGFLRFVLEAPKGITADNAAMAFSPDGRQLAFATWDQARLWDMATGEVERSWTLPKGLTDGMVFPAEDKLLLARVETREGDRAPLGNADPRRFPRVVCLRNLLGTEAAERIAEIDDFPLGAFHIGMSPDGSYFVVHGFRGQPGEANTVKAYDASGNRMHDFPCERTYRSGRTVIDPTGTRIAIHFDDNSFCWLFEMPSLRSLGLRRYFPYCFNRKAEYQVITGGQTGGYAIIRNGDATPLVRLGIDTSQDQHDVKFSHDGRLIAWGNIDGTVVVCDWREVQRRLNTVELGW
jgi:WD40 repeat protein